MTAADEIWQQWPIRLDADDRPYVFSSLRIPCMKKAGQTPEKARETIRCGVARIR